MNIMMMIMKIPTVTTLIGNLMHGPPDPSVPLLHLILMKGDVVLQTEKY